MNDPFINGIDANDYMQSCQIVECIRESCNNTNIFTPSTIKSAICVLVAVSISILSGYKLTENFDYVNTSNSGLITRDELIQLFINVGYSFNVFEQWCDDLLVAYGERMISKDCKCNCLQTCEKHEIEGISFLGFKQFLYGHSLSNSQEYRDRIFRVFDENWDDNVDFDELMRMFGDMSFDYDMDEVKKSRVTGTLDIECKVRRMIQEIDETGDGMISKAEFIKAVI